MAARALGTHRPGDNGRRLSVTAAGVVLTAIVHRRRPILAITLAATGLSLIAPITAPDDTATSMVLVATHLVAAAIVIPAREAIGG
jgi:Family of unknown function (DUF6069)